LPTVHDDTLAYETLLAVPYMSFPLESRFIEAAEQSLGIRFPASYVRFMRESNGGTTPDDRWLLHPIYDASDRTRINRTCNHLVRETERARGLEGFPEGAVVIGENLEHVFLLLLPDSSQSRELSDTVYAWHPFHRDLDTVVDDFSDFDSASAGKRADQCATVPWRIPLRVQRGQNCTR